MSLSSQLTRYRPAVVAVTGVAALYGIWAIWSASTPSQSLHRSNAIRRPRRQVNASERIRVETGLEDEDHPLGAIFYHRPDEEGQGHVFRIGLEPLPTSAYLEQIFNCTGNGLRNTIASQAIWCILAAASISEGVAMSNSRRTALVDLGIPLSDIVAASRQHDPTALERCQTQISALLGGVDSEVILDNFQQFPNSSSYMVRDNVTLETNDIADRELAETEQSQADTNNSTSAEPSHGLKGLLFFVAEEQAKRAAYEHRGITCEGCHESPIKNVRWHCLNCPDFDLCSTCEAAHDHNRTHLFVKIKTPLPALAQPSKPLPVWYPGEAYLIPNILRAEASRHLIERYALDGPHLDALYDQFTCIANVEYRSDSSAVNVAIDRKAFDKALSSEQWISPHAPNPLYERMFSFYDISGKGVIIFEDFVSGVIYLRGADRFKPLDRALKGYDFDDDGFVDRSDFLRLLRAKYALTKNITLSAALLKEAEKSYLVTEVLESSQPISSLFSDEPIPQGGLGSRRGKELDIFGDLEPVEGTKPLLDDDDEVSTTMADSSAQAHINAWREISVSTLEEALLSATSTASDAQPGRRNDSRVVPLTDEEATLLGLRGPRAREERSVPDMMWRIVEEGLHELLDPLFKSKELLDKDVLDTMEERQKWRSHIDEIAKEREQFEESLRTGANDDPLLATALQSYDHNVRPTPSDTQMQQQDVAAHFREGMVPTDPDSLERFESEIHSQPLEELLNAAGYSVADNEESAATVHSSDLPTAADIDPTPPHHRPDQDTNNNESAIPAGDTAKPSDPDALPSRERLEHLEQLDREEIVINARGGPGRLSYDEIKAIVAADESRQLKGLLTSWLEWASF